MQTKRDVEYHGWVLPAGSEVEPRVIRIDAWAGPTATCAGPRGYDIAVPTWALPFRVWNEVPVA